MRVENAWTTGRLSHAPNASRPTPASILSCIFSICIGSAFLGFSIFGRGIVFLATVIPSYFCFTRTCPQNS